MSEGLEFESFEEFWPFYMNEHAKPITRKLHFIGTMGFHILVIIALIFDWRFLILAPIVGYGLAWYSHHFIEMNRPASFRWPIWSFIADNKMVYLFLTGRMSRELRYLEKRPFYKYS
ncbi:unnamed protein product [Calypogeia fissa]